ncbi:hypothetical protein GYMLUDRAFT_251687 [Collybiopsis luxurians FD-317 M1]|uniref:Uncharacterized protein n=1 Tax=Collybiopsis luxurians FD-317 M1 TaxID=944289 RepID=A0A0D0C1Y9_9AGAR|nr:hypothetical protein GYMLUDRAFT_251687 [Collybiopsis luxurians FD-317 M1]
MVHDVAHAHRELALPMSQCGYDKMVLRVQEWNQALSSVANLLSLLSSPSVANATAKPHTRAVPVPATTAPGIVSTGSGSAGSAPMIWLFLLNPAVPLASFTSFVSTSSSSTSGPVLSGSSDRSRSKQNDQTSIYPSSCCNSLKKDKKPTKSEGKGKRSTHYSLTTLSAL